MDYRRSSRDWRRPTIVSLLLVLAPCIAVGVILGVNAMVAVLAAIAIPLAAVLWFQRGLRRRRMDRSVLVLTGIGMILLILLLLPLVDLLTTTDPAAIVHMAQDPTVQEALYLSLSTATSATLLAVILGIPMGYVLAREEFTGKALVEAIVDMPVVVPHLVAGIALVFVFGRGGAVGGPLSHFNILITSTYWGIVLAMFFVSVPFVVNYAREGFERVDPRMETVSRTLGTTRAGAMLRVTFPLSWTSLLTGAIMTWARAISEFDTVALVAYYPRTINTLFYEWFRFHGYTYSRPLAAFMLLVALAIFIALRALAAWGRPVNDDRA